MTAEYIQRLEQRAPAMLKHIADPVVRARCASLVLWDIFGSTAGRPPVVEEVLVLRGEFGVGWTAKVQDVFKALMQIGYPPTKAWERACGPEGADFGRMKYPTSSPAPKIPAK